MEQIIVNRKDGSTYLLEDRSIGRIISSAKQKVELRNNDIIDFTLISKEFFVFTIGDNFTYQNKKYTLNQIPQVHKVSGNEFQYSITFEGIQFDLRRTTYDVNIDTTGSAIYGETLTADLELFARVLISNANRVFPSQWVLGNFPTETETKTLTFSEEENCLNVLQNLCNEYNIDFVIKTENNVNTIHFQQVGQEIPLEFKVGFNQGLYNITRDKVDSTDIVTRLKVYGSDRNLGPSYRSNRLALADKNKPNSYIDNISGISKYGIYEATKIFEDIYPRRNGVVSAINTGSVYKFSDSSMDFDLKEKETDGVTTKYLLNGVSAKIHFNTGMLAGYEFEVYDYNHSTKEFHIIKITDENDYEFPSKSSQAFRIQPGDKYVILDIKMPQSYIDNAEAELLQKGTEFLSDKQEPLVQYTLEIDSMRLARVFNDSVSEIFSIGDFVKVIDEDLELNRYIRINSFERDLFNPFVYQLTLSDAKVTTSFVSNIVGEINNINNVIKNNNLRDPARAKRNWKDAQEVLDMVFDVEGDYYTDKIKPNSIETTHLQVGAKSMQFNLVNSFFSPNYNGNPNLLAWTSTKLVHFTIEDQIKEWDISAGTKTLTDNQAYYVYARCDKANSVGVIEITTDQYSVDEGTDYYYFLIGILNSYDTAINQRNLSLIYGFSTISGRFITTGRIQSADGQTYFDLDSGEIKGRITFTNEIGTRNYIQYSKIKNGVRPTSTGELFLGNSNYLTSSRIFKIEQYSDYIFYLKSKTDIVYHIGIGLWHGETYLGEGNYRKYEGNGTLFSGYANGFTVNIYIPTEGQNNIDLDSFIDDCLFKFEKGSVSTDWSPAPEDLSDKVSFLDTTINGNVAATGMLIVGSGNHSNSGISGTTDNGASSLRFWAGAEVNNRYRARWSVDDSGFERCYHSNGILASERGFDGEKWVYNMYNEQGWNIFQLDSKRGLVATSYTQESFTPSSFINTEQTNTDFNAVRSAILDVVNNPNNKEVVITQFPPEQRPQDGITGEFYNWFREVKTKININLFEYYNGTHPNNTQYESLRGWKKTQVRTDNATNGWYVKISTSGGRNFIDSGFTKFYSDTIEVILQCVYIQNGVITQTQSLSVDL